MSSFREEIADVYEDIMFADGFDDALMGVACRFGMETVACYDYDQCIDILIQDGMTLEEAEEYFEYNTLGAWVGDHTPVFVKCVV